MADKAKTGQWKNTENGVSDQGVFVSPGFSKAAVLGISQQESTNVYESWASTGTYDEVMNESIYKGPSQTCQEMEELFPTEREKPLIMDVCCGTGLVGEKMHKQGFRRIHGLDASSGMLDLAREKNVYEKLYCCYLDSSPLPMEADMYDCAVMCGGMNHSHVAPSSLRQLVRVVKPGGLVVILMRETYLTEVPEYKNGLEKEIADMEKEGLWRLASRKSVPEYFYQDHGAVFVFTARDCQGNGRLTLNERFC